MEIQRRAYAVEAELIGFDRIPPLIESLEQLQSADMTVLAIRDSDELHALLGYRRLQGSIDIDRLAVDPSQSRRGFGRKLLEHLHAKHSDLPITVSTGAANQPAIALYEHLGYVRLADHLVEGKLLIANFRLDPKSE